MSLKCIAFGNQKGGVAKTTCCLNVAYVLAKNFHMNVLLIDMDPQGSASLNCNLELYFDEDEPEKTWCENKIENLLDKMIRNQTYIPTWEEIQEYIYTPTYPDIDRDPNNRTKWIDVEKKFGFDVIPASLELSGINTKIALASGFLQTRIRTDYLRNIIDVIEKNSNYDIIIIDTPPSLEPIVSNSMTAAKDGIFVASTPDVMSVRGIQTFINTVEAAKTIVPGHAGVLGIILSLYNKNRKADHKVENWGKEFLPIPTLSARIPNSAVFGKANLQKKIASMIDNKIMMVFDSICEEILYVTDNPDALIGNAKEEALEEMQASEDEAEQ